MTEMDDFDLLAEYGARGSEAAFTALTERYVRLVYSAALRQVRDPHLAEEVTQVVFVLLARKAHTFRKGVILSAWLLRASRFTSTNLLVSQYRRVRREQQAVQMQTTSTGDASWEQIAPLLDEAMSRLGEKDRNALALRFFEQKSLEQVGVALGIDAATAQKRVWRAVDRLRQYFSRHGAAFSAATITAALSAHALHAVPAGLAATVAATAALKGTAAAASTATLLKSTLKIMAWTKAKITAAAVVGLLLAAATPIAVKEIHQHQTRLESPASNGPDFGVVELSTKTPRRLNMGAGRSCVITTTVLPGGDLLLDMRVEQKTAEGMTTISKPRVRTPNGGAFSLSIGDLTIAMTPKLISP